MILWLFSSNLPGRGDCHCFVSVILMVAEAILKQMESKQVHETN